MTTPTHDRSHLVLSLEQLRVAEAMHPGVISCPPETPLRTVARMMATYRVHAIIVFARGSAHLPDETWGVVSDLDLARAAQADDFDALVARDAAVTPALTVATGDTLARAVHLMTECSASHLVVVDSRSAHPIGVLSTLNVAQALAGFP